MSSPTATTTPYTYHKAGELATRHLVSAPSSTSNTTDSVISPTADPSSRPGLERRTTRNYEEALAATSSPSSSSSSAEPSGASEPGSKEAATAASTGSHSRPAPLGSKGRQQSYEIRDMRRAATQSYLADDKPDAGYTSATRK